MQPRCTEVSQHYNDAKCCEMDTSVEMCSLDSNWNGDQCECAATITVVALVLSGVFFVLFLVVLILYMRGRGQKSTEDQRQSMRPLSSINRLRDENDQTKHGHSSN